MKCPKCGYELTEGHLYCDCCGEEIRIVPDFEPEIEQELNETLSSLFVELEEVEAKQDNITDESMKEEEIAEPARVSKVRRRRVIAVVCFFF